MIKPRPFILGAFIVSNILAAGELSWAGLCPIAAMGSGVLEVPKSSKVLMLLEQMGIRSAPGAPTFRIGNLVLQKQKVTEQNRDALSSLLQTFTSVDYSLGQDFILIYESGEILSVAIEATYKDWNYYGYSNIAVTARGRDSLKAVRDLFESAKGPLALRSGGSGWFYNGCSLEDYSHFRDVAPQKMRELFEDKELSPRFLESVGVSEGYILGDHVRRVYSVYRDQARFFDQKVASRLGIRDFTDFMIALISLHDIGKTDAVKAGGTYLQHKLTLPILEKVMNQKGFTAHEVALAKALVGHDLLGEFLQGQLNAMRTWKSLVQIAKSIRADPKDFFFLQQLLYVSDAASYPALRDSLFKQNGRGRLVIDDPRFTYLESAMGIIRPQRTDKIIPLPLVTARTAGDAELYIKTTDGLANVKMLESSYDRNGPSVRSFIGYLIQKRFEIFESEARALKSYVNNGYQEMNRLLRNIEMSDFPLSGRRAIERDVQAMRNLFKRVPALPFDIQLYRGSPLEGRVIPQVGSLVEDAVVQSASESIGVAETYVFGVPGLEYEGAKEDRKKFNKSALTTQDLHQHAKVERLSKTGIIWVYHLPKGSKILPLQFFSYYVGSQVADDAHRAGNINTEDEVLQPPEQSRFRVVDVESPVFISTNALDGSEKPIKAQSQVYKAHLVPVLPSQN